MKLKSVWREKMRFTAEVDNHSIPMDTKSPIGEDTAATPKQMLMAAICGCTGMDVVALLKKYQQPLSKFEIEAEASVTDGAHPIVFKEVQLVFKLEGVLEKEKVLEFGLELEPEVESIISSSLRGIIIQSSIFSLPVRTFLTFIINSLLYFSPNFPSLFITFFIIYA